VSLRDENRSVYFWQNMPSPHQAPLIKAFASAWPGVVWVTLDENIDERRRQSGWSRPDYGKARVSVAPDPNARLAIEHSVRTGDISIFSGLGAYPGVASSMRRLAQRNSTIAVLYVEPWQADGWIGFLRTLKYRLLVRRWRRRVSLVLATGKQALTQWEAAGIPATTLAPFAYFVEKPSGTVLRSVEQAQVPNIVFVGSLISLKRVELLLRALSGLSQHMWQLHIVGSGPLEESLRKLADSLKISARITWHGSIDNERAQRRIMGADVLVLPSARDGWGAVVSEALLQGTPVVVSKAAGSSELITDPSMGIVVRVDSLSELQEALECMVLKGPQRPEDRASLATECDRRMSAAVGASYLTGLLTSLLGPEPRPHAPWLGACPCARTAAEAKDRADIPCRDDSRPRDSRNSDEWSEDGK
jgi:glycosyltransferase involved in cell wall biosynthesis